MVLVFPLLVQWDLGKMPKWAMGILAKAKNTELCASLESGPATAPKPLSTIGRSDALQVPAMKWTVRHQQHFVCHW